MHVVLFASAAVATFGWLAPPKPSFTLGPVRHLEYHLWDVMSTSRIVLVWHGAGISGAYGMPIFYAGHSSTQHPCTSAKLLAQWAKTQVLVIDDWALAPLTDEARRDFLEIFDDRHGHRSTIVTSQLLVELWHDSIGDPTLADAILDRRVHNAHPLCLSGESMRKRNTV